MSKKVVSEGTIKMRLSMCTETGKPQWFNKMQKDGHYRCTKCGEVKTYGV